MSAVIYYASLMLIFYLTSAALSYLLAVLMIKLSQKVVYSMRKELFDHLTDLPIGYFDTHATGELISRISYDIDTVNTSLSHDVLQVGASIVTVTGSLIMMASISPMLLLVFVVTIPISILYTRYRSNKVRPLFRIRSQKLGELNGYAEEMLSGQKTIRAYSRESVIGKRFDEKNREAAEAYYNAEYYSATVGPTVNFINNLSLSLFLMTLPTHLQEFVVLHELCHTVHHNHSAEFHALLNKVTGGREAELNRQLKSIRKNLRFRKGAESDLERIMELVADAQNWFRREEIDQWQDGYPTREIILSDILGGENCVVEHNGVVVATFVASFAGEPTYAEIKGKGWLNENSYAVVHRIAVADECRRKGIAREILHYAEELSVEQGIADIRIDTHRDNRAMRSLLKKLGYTHCGRITLTSGAFREAYHKELK